MGEMARWQAVAWAVAAALTVFAGARMLGERRSATDAPAVKIAGPERPESGAAAGSAGASGTAGKDRLYVHVAGEVRRPGLLRVPAGARVAVAIERAGGATHGADLTAVNLAQPLEDGQQVIVPRRGSAAGAGASAGGPAGAAGPAGSGGAGGAAPPSLATASAEQLEQLDGIGPALAKRIIEYRESHGGFRSVGELREVEGIGEKRFAALQDAVRP